MQARIGHIIANLLYNATEIVRFLKYVGKVGFFFQKSWIFSKSVKSKFAVECVSNGVVA